jgi:UDP-glucuronate decarboxylase
MAKILITGGAGFIPSSLARRLSEDKINQIFLVDNLVTGNINNIPANDNCHFIKADVNHYEEISAIMTSNKFDFVFHYAALVGVKRTLKNPVMVLNDIAGIKNILELCKNTGVQRVFFSSSSEVYGEPVEFPQNEKTTPLNSRLPYAIVKNVGEAFLKSYKVEYNLNYTIFRFFNTYGPNQSIDFVISKFLKSALNNEDITIYGDGSQTRTFCYIQDNIDVTIKVMNDKKYENETINIGNHNEISILELAKLIIGQTGSSSRIIHLPPLEEGDMTRRLPDNSIMRKILDRDFMDLKDGIKKILESNTIR